MEILPSEYQQLELDRTEKMFIRYAESCNEYGYVFLNTNPAMIQNEKQHLVITKSGIVLVKFFEKFIVTLINHAFSCSVFSNSGIFSANLMKTSWNTSSAFSIVPVRVKASL